MLRWIRKIKRIAWREFSHGRKSSEERIAELEAEVARLRATPDVKDGMRRLNLTVEKARTQAAANGPVLAAAASTWSTACCVATFSSASSYCVSQAMVEADPEMAAAFVILHKRAVEVMGETGTVDALIKQAADHEVLTFDPARRCRFTFSSQSEPKVFRILIASGRLEPIYLTCSFGAGLE